MQSLNDLKILDAIERFRSIRKAADHMSLTPSALSRKILALETQFGVELFERTSKGLRLNRSGQYLTVYARSQLAEFEKVRGELQAIKKTTSGHVRICASQSVLESFLPVHLARFQLNNPKVTVSINHSSSARAMTDLQEYHSDIGLCLNLSDHTDLSVLGDADQEIYAVVTTSHPLAAEREVSIAEIARHQIVLPPQGSGLRLMLDQHANRENTFLTPAVESNTYASIASACRNAGLVTFGLSLYEQTEDGAGNVALIRIRKMPPANVRLVKLHGRTLSPAADKLARYLGNRMRGRAVADAGQTTPQATQG
ncbi:LysR family transcriptional regulator [Pseudooceanicola algae]|uniref:HTH-type transcriptional regulator HdfR n=1 Tax=Pseudooceanicola algae TaxID=1537215 RepID=A0A418SLD6_9RHOB|nr:LysR family transcriptional regulator [Pseudooceanicola algae]QPM90839.1 HTH-type transcriptional regulator HdfR [Pseudooceanicola algae]